MGHLKCDHIRRVMKFSFDYIKRLVYAKMYLAFTTISDIRCIG
jgi:hypothetical protein